MYKVYFDWNVFAMLRENSKDEVSKELKEIVFKNLDNILFPYSQAHIGDLSKGAEKLENQNFINSDLNHLDKVSDKYCLIFDFDKNNVIPKIGSSRNLFESHIETNTEDILNPDFIDKTFKKIGLGSLGKLFSESWKLLPTGIDFNKLENGLKPDAVNIYEQYFHRTKESNTMHSFMLDWSKFNKELNNDPEIYKLLAKEFREQMGFDPSRLSNKTNPINEIDQIIKEKIPNSSFSKISSVEGNNKYTNNIFSKYCMEFTNLDLSGFRPDTLSLKNQFSNFTNDVHHSFYAIYCDYFVTNEKKLISKSNIMYERFKSSTIAIKPQEFITIFKHKLNFELNTNSFFDQLKLVLAQPDFIEINDDSFSESNCFRYKADVRIIGYFNYLYLIYNNSKKSIIVLEYFNNTYENFMYYKEFETVINKLFSIFGNDVNGNGGISVSDKEQIRKKDWCGRIWLSNSKVIQLVYSEEASFKLIIQEIPETEII